jgi:hypothetical protein
MQDWEILYNFYIILNTNFYIIINLYDSQSIL